MRKQVGLFGMLLLGSALMYGCSDAMGPGLAPSNEAALSKGRPAHAAEAAASKGRPQHSVDAAASTGRPAHAQDTVSVVQRNRPLARDIAVTQRIGRNGGKIEIRDAGLTVIFPRGAVPVSGPHGYVEITVTALRGNHVAYEFQPHGLQFEAPVQVEQHIRFTNVHPSINGRKNSKSPADAATGAYFPDRRALLGDGTAVVTEYQETEAPTTVNGSRFRWQIEHFSGYLLASNRSGFR